MDVNKLVRMANQIATNFDYGQGKQQAAASVLDHLRRFWTADMKDAIVAYHREGAQSLSEVAALAVEKLAEERSAA
jgi:formate dehydrogenase subunit delta